MKYKITLAVIAAVFTMSSCKDLINPAIENNRQLDESTTVPSDARFPFAVLLNAYNRIPTNSWSFNDVATDDAVTNDKTSGFLKMATGQWTANNNGRTVMLRSSTSTSCLMKLTRLPGQQIRL